MIIEILALSLAENGVILRYNHLRRGDYSGRTYFENGRLALCLCLKRKWFHNRFWPLWWSVSLSIRVQTTLNHIWFVFYHNVKDNDRDLCQDLLTIENTDSDLKVHTLHYANELLVRVRLSQHAEAIRKKNVAFGEQLFHIRNCSTNQIAGNSLFSSEIILNIHRENKLKHLNCQELKSEQLECPVTIVVFNSVS